MRCAELLGNDHPETVISMTQRAQVTKAQGRYQEAREQFREALKGWERLYGLSHPESFQAASAEARCSYKLGDLAAARARLERTLPAAQGGQLADGDIARSAFRLLYTVDQAGGWTEPRRRLVHDMLPVWRRIVANGGDESYTAHLGIALAFLDEGHADRSAAEQALREAKRSAELMAKDPVSSEITRVCSALAAQAQAESILGHPSDAVRLQREAIQKVPPDERLLRARFEALLAQYEAAAR